VITADGAIPPGRMQSFNEISVSLGVEPTEIWQKLANPTAE
jgi:hypothetical protein